MILIISNSSDITTNEVINWLLFFNKEFLRINEDDLVEYLNVSISNELHNVKIKIKNKVYNLNEFEAVWYRRGFIKTIKTKLVFDDAKLKDEIEKQLSTESANLNSHFLNSIAKRSINKPDDVFLNKMDALSIAPTFDINIPNTIITSSKEELTKFYKNHKKIITKNFTQGVFIQYKENYLSSYTRIVTEDMLDTMPDYFFPTMFQEMIEKVFEIRAFFIKKSFYSSAIFSQNDNQTNVDFRNYNEIKPNRTPPFKLPSELEEKLGKLMSALTLNSGSIDLIVTPEGRYIFLEVNPIGQFAQVSTPCNYYLEKRMALELI